MMPFDKVMHKFKHGKLHSGSKSGPPVKNRRQAIAIMMSEKAKASGGKSEYKSRGVDVAPSNNLRKKNKI